MTPIQDRTQEIKRELAELNQSLKMTVQKAIRVGELLTEQKEYVGHGKFLSWVESNLDIDDNTVYRYMKLHKYNNKIPKLGNLQEAYQQIETLERQERMSIEEKKRSMVNEFKRTGVKPSGWDRSLDYMFQKEKDEYEKTKVRVDNFMKKMREETEEREREKLTDDFMMNNAKRIIEESIQHLTERQSWMDKIRLSSNSKDDSFMNAIMDYLETLDDDNRRIEACNNIIKICRNISVQLQKVKGE